MKTQDKQPTCDQRIKSEMVDRLSDLRILWDIECGRDISSAMSLEELKNNLGEFNDYGLGFWYTQGKDGEEGFFCYQFSTGGPQDELRFFCDAALNLYRVEYWFLDWFDGASRRLHCEDKDLAVEIFEMFKEVGMVEGELEKSKE